MKIFVVVYISVFIRPRTSKHLNGTRTSKQRKGTRTSKQLNGTRTSKQRKGTRTSKQLNGTRTIKHLNGTRTRKQRKGTRTSEQRKGTRTCKQLNGTRTSKQLNGTLFDTMLWYCSPPYTYLLAARKARQGIEGVELCSHITVMKLFALYVTAVFIYVPELLWSHRNQSEGF